jgi:hypothetical protein
MTSASGNASRRTLRGAASAASRRSLAWSSARSWRSIQRSTLRCRSWLALSLLASRRLTCESTDERKHHDGREQKHDERRGRSQALIDEHSDFLRESVPEFPFSPRRDQSR